LKERASVDIATRWHAAVLQTCKLLERQPDVGRPRHDLPWEGLRTLRVKHFNRYLIFYRWEGDRVDIIRVKHGMMSLPELFTSEEG
jgi:plasmid stabilization system protein ParE